MIKGIALLSAFLAALLLAACNGGGEQPQPTVSISPSPAVARPSPTLEPTPKPEVNREPRLIFLRSLTNPIAERPTGVIHISDLDGSNVIQLSPGDVQASFVGLAESDGTAILYYIAVGQTGNVFTLETRDLNTGEITTQASLAPLQSTEGPPSGSLSPDGTHIAISHSDGIDLLDLTNGERRRVLTSNRDACETGPSECYLYGCTDWSPDGQHLLLRKGLYEGSATVVVDPFLELLPELGGGDGSPDAWSPNSDAVCSHGASLGGSRSLFVAKQPDWQSRNLLPEYDIYDPSATRFRSAYDCAWLDDHRIAVVTLVDENRDSSSERSIVVSIYDLTTEQLTELIDFGVWNPPCCVGPPELLAVPGANTLVVNVPGTGQSELLDASTGFRTPILQAGDWVLAVTQPIALPEEIDVATPEARPCLPLSVKCEAQVTNVAPEKLNLRDGPPSTLSEVTGRLDEGSIVCLTGSPLFAAGFRWWLVRSEDGIEGWAAQGDSEDPERPWLTPTGRKCEE